MRKNLFPTSPLMLVISAAEADNMDNFRIIYRILRYLEKALDYDEPDMERISAKALGLSEQRWTALMSMLAKEGYVEGISIQKSFDGETAISISNPQITLKGLEYLQENSLMKKAAALAKGVADIIS